jgi:quercetin dioxygenase-like cupin family protein
MITVQLSELELMEYWGEGDPTLGGKAAFPIQAKAGAASTATVYFEQEPGQRCGRHTHSAEEIMVILEGDAEVLVEDERRRVSAGDMVLFPAAVSHDVYSVGDSTLRAASFFSSAAVVTTFDDRLAPMDTKVVIIGAPLPDAGEEAKAALADAAEAERY